MTEHNYTPISYEPKPKRPEPSAVQHALIMLLDSAGAELNLPDAVRSVIDKRFADDEIVKYKRIDPRVQDQHRRRVFLKVDARRGRVGRSSIQIITGDY